MKNNSSLDPVEVLTSPEEDYLTSVSKFQGIPGIEITQNGRLWATWYAGGETEGPDNYVILITSTDKGKTWSKPITVIDPPGNVRAYDPTLWIDSEMRLWLFWAQCLSKKNGNIFDGVGGVWGIHTNDIESETPTWTSPVRLANGVMMNKPTIISNGEWAFPTALWYDCCGGKVSDDLKNEQHANITISEDKGNSFYFRGGADLDHRVFDEHMIVELNDKRLWMLIRTEYGIGESFSDDLGKNWSTGKDSGIPGPNSRFFIRRLESGNLLLVNHQVDHENQRLRHSLTAYLSDDDGQTWQGGLLLDERESVSYPDGKQDSDGNIWIIYDHDRCGHGHILLARFREEDIMAEKLISEHAELKIIVGKMK